MEGRLISGDPATVWRGAALDSRRLAGGELFFALPGERVDGHRFVAGALAAGAAAAVVTRPVAARPEATLIQVDDSLRALHRLTRAVREPDAAAAGGHHRLDRQDDHQGAAGGDAGPPLPGGGDAGQPEQPLRLSAGAARHPRGDRVDGRRDGHVDTGRVGRRQPAGAARRGGVHQRAAGPSDELRVGRGDRRRQGGAARRPGRGRPGGRQPRRSAGGRHRRSP